MLHRFAAVTASLLAGAGLLTAPAAARALSEQLSPDPNPHTSVSALAAGAVAPVDTARRCGPEPSTGKAWERLFDSLSGTWSGGDGAASLRLPDGRMMWLFGDTMTGSFDAAGRRGLDSALVRNSIVITDGACASVLPTVHDALPGAGATWLWPTQGVVAKAGSRTSAAVITVFAQRVRRTGPGAYDFARVGAATIRVSVPWRGTPTVGSVTNLPENGVLWGAALVADGATTWVYGTRAVTASLVFGRDLLLARAPTTTVGDTRTWTYRTRSGWSRDWRDAAVIRPARQGVSTVPSAQRVGSGFVIVTKAQEFLDSTVVALRSRTPWGPWTRTALFQSPSRGSVVRYSPALVSGATSRRAVVVVSRTSTSPAQLAADVELARPTFTDVRLG
jgi:hypothetical protein